MPALNPKLGALILSLVLMTTGIGLAATGGAPPLSVSIAPFGCGA